MAPIPQEPTVELVAAPEPGDSPPAPGAVVITGMSGLLPGCLNVQEFAEKLYNKENLVKKYEPRWDFEHPELREYYGRLPGLDRFDAQFFMVHYRMGNVLDAISRKVLEQTYQAIFDAGISPAELATQRVGVYIGVGATESEKGCAYGEIGLGILGCNRAMIANRVSYWLNVKGPSIVIDSSCCSSLAVFEKAYEDIATGVCDAAVVGAGKLLLHPHTLIHYHRCNRAIIANRVPYWLNMKGPSIVIDSSCCSSLAVFEKAYEDIATGVCDAAGCRRGRVLLLHPHTLIHYHRTIPQNEDGKIKSYDINADGQSSSEAINVFLLQKYKNSKRVYASLCYAKTQYGVVDDKEYMNKFGFERDPEFLAKFLREFYTEAGIPPSLVEYVEGFGAAVPEADKTELQAIEEVFCKDRSNPLLLGSVMSNMGYTEAASGTSAILKTLLAYQRGELAANLHCDSPRRDIAALRDGRMRIVTEHQRFRRSYAAVNGLSVTGVNGHALLAGHYKPKDLSRYQSEIPYLVTMSGRIESAVQKLIDHFKSDKLDPEEIALFHNIHKNRINGHLARGFGIFSPNAENETITHREEADYYDDAQRPLWFVYSGMGSQWVGMGTQLMRMPVFAAAIERCRKVLEPKGVDIIRILTSPEEDMYDNILHSFVGIAAVQIGLTDVLTSIGLVPDKIIGHSVGELGCAYADGCLTAEEMILAAYSRGRVSQETPFIVGSMAAVGLGYEKISALLPPEIEVACHNGPDSSTISGPANVMREFVAQLTAKGIFAKEVPCSNIAYHSRYIAKAGPGLLQYLRETIKNPQLRSERWVSTSVPQNRWHEDAAKYSSAEYHTNNLLSPVLFEETARLIPANAMVVEIAPHGLLQAILKKSLPVSCKNIALTQKGHSDNTLFLLEAIGKLYMNGYDPNVAALYPQVEFPVSTETPSLSHLIEWVYADHWKLCLFVPVDRAYSTVYKPIITAYDDEYAYLTGHVIEGTRIFPSAASLVLVWDTLAMSLSKPRRSLPVKLSDIHFHVQPRVTDSEALHLTVALQKGTGRFEVFYEHGLIVEGYIVPVAHTIIDLEIAEKDSLELTSLDVYKLLHEKGYDYKGEFRSIVKTDLSFEQAKLIWNNNWVTLIDGLFQLNALRRSHSAISQPSRIKTLNISPNTHLQKSQANCVDVKIYEMQEATRCNSIILEKITFVDKPCIMRQSSGLKALQFYPFFLQEDADIFTTLYMFMQIVKENLHDKTIRICDIICSNKPSIIDSIQDLLLGPPEIKHELVRVQKTEVLSLKDMNIKPDVLIVNGLLSDIRMFEVLFHCISPNTFIVSIGVETESLYPAAVYRPVSVRGQGQNKMELALWRPSPSTSSTALTVRNSSEVDFLQDSCSHLPPQNKLFVLASYPPPLGLKEIIKQQKKLCNRNINVAIIKHKDMQDVDQELDNLPNFDLTYNILHHGQWGGEYYMPLPKNVTAKQTVALRSSNMGKLDSLNWVEVSEVGEGVSVKVCYAAVNTYDAKRATAEIPVGNENHGYGLDFSGITDRGDRVFGILRNGSICNRATAQPELLWPVPEYWDLEDAATVPLPYLQAFYCLTVKTNLCEGMRVLIHSGAGALGQAAISIALAMNCEVFTTVSDIGKKKFLTKLFPELKASHIGNSRDGSFSDMVLNGTNGRGCHIIINTLKGQRKNASLSCCSPCGMVLDTVQIHLRDNFTYGMFHMTQERSYVPVDVMEIFESRNLEQLKKLHLLVTRGISQGYVRPLSRVTYSPLEVPRAFRLLASSNHRGRVLIRIADEEIPINSLAQPRLTCSPDHQQLLISDEDMLCSHVADRLINRGAKKLRLYLPRPSSYINSKKIIWREQGVRVDIVFNDVWKKEELTKFLQDSHEIGAVESLFFLTRHTNSNQLTGKSSIIKSLDMVSRELFSLMRHFTVISEHHHFAREICEDRAFYGLPSLSLQLQNMDQFDEIGHTSHKIASDRKLKLQVAVEIIEKALCSKLPVVFGYAQTEPRRTILEELARIPGISVTSATDQRSTLEKVGLDHGRAQELCHLLEEKYNIVLPKDSLPGMTIKQLKSLQDQFTDVSKEELGLGSYFNAIDADELITTSGFVLKATLLQNLGRGPDDIDTSNTYLCIVPGVEGYHNRFDVLCERLKMPAAVLNPSIDDMYTNIPELAQKLVNVMVQRLRTTKTFYLLGYEMGVLVALEMAVILESYGLSGTIYCLGGTPEDIQTALEINLKGMSDHKLQDSILQHLTTMMIGHQLPELLEHLQMAKTWQDKVELCVKMCRGQAPYTSQFMRTYFKAAYNRIELTRNHKARPHSLGSKIVILRAAQSCPFNLQSMTSFSKEPISIHEIPSSLSQAPKNLQCSAIINKYLDPDALEAFENTNHCDSYMINDHLNMKFVSQEI